MRITARRLRKQLVSRQNKQSHCNMCVCEYVCVCAQHFPHWLWGQITQKTFTHTRKKHRLCDPTCSTKQDFPPVPIRGCYKERERGKWRGMGCTSAWRTHLFNSFSYISAIFFSIMCRHVPATCSPICPVPFCDCLHCFLFFFYSRNCHFQCLDSTRLGFLFLRFSSCPTPSHSLTITKG